MGIFEPNIARLKAKHDTKGLIKALRHKKPSVREEAARALGIPGGIEAIDALLVALEDSNSKVCASAAYALGLIGEDEAAEPLANRMQQGASDVRNAASDALMQIGGAKTVGALSRVLKHGFGDSRGVAAKLLGQIRDPIAAECLVEALGDDAQHVWRAAENSLTMLGYDAQDPLIQTLRNGNAKESHRCISARVLGKVGDAMAIEPLFEATNEKEPITRLGRYDRIMSAVCRAAWDALKDLGARIGDPIVIHAVQALGREDSYDRGKAAEVLGEVSSLTAVPALSEALGDRDCPLQVKTALEKIVGYRAMMLFDKAAKGEQEFVPLKARFLAILEIPDTVDGFIKALEAEPECFREAAAEFLGLLGDQRAVEPLARALDRGTVVLPAVQALARFGDKRAASMIIDQMIQTHEVYSSELFEDYKDLISEAVTYSCSSKTVGLGDPLTRYTYSLHENAVCKLCQIDSPVSTNILHKLAEIPDTKPLVLSEQAIGIQEGPVSFEPIREIARNELKRRGNPPYNSGAYVAEGAWRISEKDRSDTKT